MIKLFALLLLVCALLIISDRLGDRQVEIKAPGNSGNR